MRGVEASTIVGSETGEARGPRDALERRSGPSADERARDDRVLARLAAGDVDALRDLMTAHGAVVLDVVHRLTRDHALAQDLTQETFLRVFERASSYTPGNGARAWLVTIARNLALKTCRRRAVEARPRPGEPARVDDPGAALATRELGLQIDDALARIDEPFRSAMLLCAVEGLSYAEAALVCGCSAKTLSSRLARARARFRELMAPYLDGPAPRSGAHGGGDRDRL